MNKKFSTLVAVLLASGGLSYAVGTMITPDGVQGTALTSVMARAQANDAGEIVGYTIAPAAGQEGATKWSLVSNNAGGFYLSPADGWYLAADATVKKVEGNTPDAVTISAETGVLSIDNKTVVLAGDKLALVEDVNAEQVLVLFEEEVVVTSAAAKTELLLATTATGTVDLTGQFKGIATTLTPVSLTWSASTATAATWSSAQAFTVETAEGGVGVVLCVKDAEENVWYLHAESGAVVTYVLDKSKASALTVGNGAQLTLGGFSIGKENNDLKAGATTGALVVKSDKSDYVTAAPSVGDEVYIATGTKSAILSDNLTPVESFTPASVTVNAATALASLTAADANTWTYASEKLSIDGFYLSYDKEKASFGTTANEKNALQVSVANNQLNVVVDDQVSPVYFAQSDNALTLDASADNTPVTLYGIEERGNLIAENPAETLTAGAKYVIAELRTETVVGDKLMAATPTVVELGNQGGEYTPITGMVIGADGDITLTNEFSNNNMEVPVYLSLENGTDGKPVYIKVDGKTTAKPGEAASFVLVNGKYRCINLANAGKAASYLKVTKTNGKISYSFVAEGSASQFNYAAGALTVDTDAHPTFNLHFSQMYAAADECNACEIPLFDSWGTIDGDYVILGGKASNGKFYFVNEDGSLTESYAQAELWKVARGVWDANNRTAYTFTSRTNGKKLTIGNVSSFMAGDYTRGFKLIGVDQASEAGVVFNTSTGSEKIEFSSNRATAQTLGLYRSTIEQFSAEWLVHRFGSNFKLNIVNKYKDIDDKTINGNEFDTNLVPVVPYTAGSRLTLVEVLPKNNVWGAGEKDAFLLKKQGTGLYIVLNVTDKWSNAANDFVNGGYKFDLLSEENVRKVLNGETVEGKTYYPYFRINYLEGVTDYAATNNVENNIINNDKIGENTPVFCIEVGNGINDGNFYYDLVNLETTDNNGHLDVFVTVNERCADNESRKPSVSFTDGIGGNNIVHGEDATNNPLNYRYVNISFKAADIMQFKNENGEWVNLNGKVLGMNSKEEAAPSEKEYFLADKAEGQWAVSMTDAAGATAKDGVALSGIDSRKFTFTNRENPNATFAVTAMHALGNDVYAVEYESRDKVNGFYGVNNNRNRAERDTLIITAAKGLQEFEAGKNGKNDDSYAKWTKEELQDKTFQLSIDAAAELFVVENEGKGSHFLGLSTEEAANWRLVPFTAERKHEVDAAKYLTAGTDSVYVMGHPQRYASDGKFYAYNDTTAIVTYALQNIQNNEWLTFDPTQSQTILSMICDPNSKHFTTEDLNSAYRFVLKEKAEGAQKLESGKYNIIGVDAWKLGANSKYVSGDAYYKLNLNRKLYGAATYQNKSAVEVEKAYVQPTSNDIFTIASLDAAEYVKKDMGDVIRLFRAENESDVLYENGQFLNAGNINQIKNMAPALYLDTAYVNREGNNRYQYLIVVNPNYVEAIYDNKNHLIEPDTLYGRFLVNQIDSAVMVSKNHNNKFINDIEADRKELKLAFQYGYRTADTLHLTNGEGGEVIEKIDLSTADFNKAKFAFKYVNNLVDDQFKVQTRWYDYDAAVKAGLDKKDQWTSNNEGYLKVINGVVVVTDSFTNAEEFQLAAEESTPTANEGIAAEGISVVGTNGAVIVKGAEGKNVVITNVLGQQVANTVVSSSEATIAAPAGVVVVAVEGEAAVKAIVK